MRKALKKMSLSSRVFLSMLGIIALSFIMTGAISIYFFKNENEQYNLERLKRKEYAVRAGINYLLNQEEGIRGNTDLLVRVFDERICELADIHNQDIGLYDLEGNYIISSISPESENVANLFSSYLNPALLDFIPGEEHTIYARKKVDGKEYILAGSILKDADNVPVAILKIPYHFDARFQEIEQREYLKRLIGVFLGLFLIATLIAYVLSNTIIRQLSALKKSISGTKLIENKPITGKYPPEIEDLIREYNKMLEALQHSALELAARERNIAWRDMARQVAHEIKNPLTPLRLNLQLLQNKITTESPEKIKILIDGLITQIDALTEIAETFSRYASLPKLKREPLNFSQIIIQAMGLFAMHQIKFDDKTEGHAPISGDREQLVRALNNLINNAIQATKAGEKPTIHLILKKTDENFVLEIHDKGHGIPAEQSEMIFEPRFTTKSSGMGLGLSIVKGIITGLDGQVSFESEVGAGTTFYVILPQLK